MIENIKFSIKQARKYRGYTQKEIAEKMDIHRSTYIKYEKNPELITYSHGLLFAKIVDIPLDMLYFLPHNSTLSGIAKDNVLSEKGA